MKVPRALVPAAAAVVLSMAGVAYAASPSSGSIGPSDPRDEWAGKHFTLGAVRAPGLCNQEECDHFGLTVAVSSSYWNDHTGSTSISISWKSPTDNFDLYLYKGGQLQKSSTQVLGTSEAVSLSSPSETYQVLVVPVLVADSGYSGHAMFSSETKPTPPTPPGGGGGGSSDGGGGGSGNGGSSGGSGGGSGRFVGSDPYTGPSYYGGGTVRFGPQDRAATSRQIHYGTGSPKSQRAYGTRTQPVALTVPQLPQFVWLLLPLGMIILVAVAYSVFEPEPEIAEEPLPEPSWRSQQPTLTPAPIALAGVVLRTASKLGNAARRRFARVVARR